MNEPKQKDELLDAIVKKDFREANDLSNAESIKPHHIVAAQKKLAELPGISKNFSTEAKILALLNEKASDDTKRQAEILTQIPGENPIQIGANAQRIEKQRASIKSSFLE